MPQINNVSIPYTQGASSDARRQDVASASRETSEVTPGARLDSSTNTASSSESVSARAATAASNVESGDDLRDDATVQAFENQLQSLVVTRSLQQGANETDNEDAEQGNTVTAAQGDENTETVRSRNLNSTQQAAPEEGLGLIVNTRT